MKARNQSRYHLILLPSTPAFNAGALTALVTTASLTAAFAVEQLRRRTGCKVARRRVHIEYTASSKTSHAPCVVFEAGANSWSTVWDGVVGGLSNEARTFTYDRPGFGRSPFIAPPPQLSLVPATGVRLLRHLQNVDAGPPYVLVAHSLGALYLNEALRRLPREDILGVVYVDAASPESVKLLRDVVPRFEAPGWLAGAMSSVGLLRAIAPAVLASYAEAFRKLPGLWAEAREVWSRAEWLQAYTAEWVGVMKSVEEGQVKERGQWLCDCPITVIVPDVYERTVGKEYVGAMQRLLASYSSDARLLTVKSCGHFVQIERPDVVVEAVRDIVRRAKKKCTGAVTSSQHTCRLND